MRSVVRTLLIGAVFLRFICSAEAQLAAAYVVADQTTGYIVDSYKAEGKRQVASLTKIATGKVDLDWAAKTGADLAAGGGAGASNNGVRRHKPDGPSAERSYQLPGFDLC